jgi:hypothetical protein
MRLAVPSNFAAKQRPSEADSTQRGRVSTVEREQFARSLGHGVRRSLLFVRAM